MEIKEKATLYFPVYKRIENEVLQLASAIFFCDKHRDVYSLDIADLIIRCAIEIESLAKDIFRRENGSSPSSPSECFSWMENNWKISQKEVIVHSPLFHFDTLGSLCPFDYKNGSEEDYYSTYNAIKHDRAKNINNATVDILIRALGALYILNIYFEHIRIPLNDDRHAVKVDKTFGSEVFEIQFFPCPEVELFTSEENIVKDKCIFKIIREEAEYAFNILYKTTYGEIHYAKSFINNNGFQDYVKSCIGHNINITNYWENLSLFSKATARQIQESFFKRNKVGEILSITAGRMDPTYWVVYNAD